MILEEQRILHEDLERLEAAIADRLLQDPKQIRERLSRDHQISGFLERMRDQSQRLLGLYADADGSRQREVQQVSTGDPFDEFYRQLASVRDFHRRYPNEPVENLERAYKRRAVGEAGEPVPVTNGRDVDNMFTGEEGFGRFFDLTALHEDYVNLPGVKGARRVTYLQYLDSFDVFTPPQCPIKRPDKMTDAYFRYVGALASYLESFMRRTKPLDDLPATFAEFDADFERAWDKDEVPGWSSEGATAGASLGKAAAPITEGTGEGIWCADCEKEFKNENVYKHHLTQKKHIKNAEARANGAGAAENGNNTSNGSGDSQSRVRRLKERAVAEREHRVRRLAAAMQTERSDTRVNVERKAGMTERERQQELEALYAEAEAPLGGADDGEGAGSDSDDERIYNPLKLPLAWDGKPIPYWLYKLHGLGVEFPCEICGNFVYMGRRAFDKHFSEARHTFGLKSLGISRDFALFREITGIDDAIKLWEKVQRDKKDERRKGEGVVQMEDGEGNVMPEKVYWDLQKQGLL